MSSLASWLVITVMLSSSICIICLTISNCINLKYEYWKNYDKGVTDNLNKQLEFNKLKLKKEVRRNDR